MADQPSPTDSPLIRKISDAELDSIVAALEVHTYISQRAALEERHRRQKERDEKKEKTQSRILVMAVLAVVIALVALIVAVVK